MKLRNSSGALIVPLLMTFGAVAHADEWNKETKITVNQAIQVPGAVLPAGSYIFKLVDSQSNRNIVQVLNPRQDHVYATVIAINNYQMEPKGHTVFTFYEVPAGNPQPVKAWFYPGDNYGQEFVYTKHERELFAQVHDTTPAMPTPQAQPEPQVAAAAPAPEPAPAPAVVEEQQTTIIARNEPPANTAEAPAPMPTTPVMPQTASNIPLLALLGLVSNSAAVGLSVFAKRISE
jgi:hypothetical protein